MAADTNPWQAIAISGLNEALGLVQQYLFIYLFGREHGREIYRWCLSRNAGATVFIEITL